MRRRSGGLDAHPPITDARGGRNRDGWHDAHRGRGVRILALAVFVRGLVISQDRPWHGVATGVCLTLAALTTPRTYRFLMGFRRRRAPTNHAQ